MIARKTWLEVRWMTLAHFVVLEAMLVAAVLYWPEIAPNLRKLSAIKSLVPGEFMKRMFQGVIDHGYPAYITVQQFFKGVNIISIATAVLLATGTIAGERETGTIEFLLSRPASRLRVLWSKFWVLALCVVVPIFASTATIPLLEGTIPADTVKISPDFWLLMWAAYRSALFCLFFLTATLMFSTMFAQQVHVAFAIGSLIVVQVGMFFVQVLRHGSIFMLSDYDTYWPIVAGNREFSRLFWSEDIWLILGCLVLYGISAWRFRRQDI